MIDRAISPAFEFIIKAPVKAHHTRLANKTWLKHRHLSLTTPDSTVKTAADSTRATQIGSTASRGDSQRHSAQADRRNHAKICQPRLEAAASAAAARKSPSSTAAAVSSVSRRFSGGTLSLRAVVAARCRSCAPGKSASPPPPRSTTRARADVPVSFHSTMGSSICGGGGGVVRRRQIGNRINPEYNRR